MLYAGPRRLAAGLRGLYIILMDLTAGAGPPAAFSYGAHDAHGGRGRSCLRVSRRLSVQSKRTLTLST